MQIMTTQYRGRCLTHTLTKASGVKNIRSSVGMASKIRCWWMSHCRTWKSPTSKTAFTIAFIGCRCVYTSLQFFLRFLLKRVYLLKDTWYRLANRCPVNLSAVYFRVCIGKPTANQCDPHANHVYPSLLCLQCYQNAEDAGTSCSIGRQTVLHCSRLSQAAPAFHSATEFPRFVPARRYSITVKRLCANWYARNWYVQNEHK